MASVAAPPMSPSWVARRQTSTSTVVRSAVPKTLITPKEVKVNRKTIAAAAAIADRSSGSVTDRNVRHGPAPSVAAASSRSVGIRSHEAPTVRTTTARLKATCAPRIAHTLRSRASGRIATKAAPTTTVGNTNTAVSVLVSNRLPAKSNRVTAHAGARPMTIVNTVLTTACQVVNHSTRHVSVRPSVARSESPLRPRRSNVVKGHP